VSPKAVRRAYRDGCYGQIHVREAGSPTAELTPLLCFHLSPKSGRVYEQFIAEMGQDRLCLAPDTPGFGASDGPDGEPEIGDYARCLSDLLDSYGLDGVDLMGYHTGSKIAVELALQQPDRVRHLVLISAPVYPPDELEQMRQMYAATPPREDGSHLTSLWRPAWRWRGPCQTPQDLNASLADTLCAGPRYWWGHRAAFRYPMEAHLPRVTQPVMVLRPGDDLWAQTERARSLIRQGGMVDLADWGHGFLDYQTEAAARLVRAFLDEDRLPAAG
jgi:pimeloyl-ACP methyl ester carboxylesterase